MSAWVFHDGALGDVVLAWPLMRAMARAMQEKGAAGEVCVVAAGEKARLTEREVGAAKGRDEPRVRAFDREAERWRRLWMGEVAQADRVTDARIVYSFVAGKTNTGGQTWLTGARRMFAEAQVVQVGEPGTPSRQAAWARERVSELGGVVARANADGPVVMHVGAGSEEKRWPMARWAGLARRLRARGERVVVIAGEVEAERLSAPEKQMFADPGGISGEMLASLAELADMARSARVFVGADTGPTHLAAQLGVRTVALFGPTDPAIWRPIGATGCVEVVSPEGAMGMEWLSVERVAEAVEGVSEKKAGGKAQS